MAQFNRRTNEYVDRNNDLFEVVLLGDEHGGIATNRYAMDAWGRPKSIIDHTIFSATWTFGVPNRVWEQTDVDSTAFPVITSTYGPIDNVYVRSRENMLSVMSGTSSGIGHICKSKTFPRYQPNKGQLYSTAVTCPNPTLVGERSFGLGTSKNAISFVLEGDGANWELYARRIRSGTVETSEPLRQYLPNDFDPSKGHVYDIQFEWRGVGNVYFFVDLELIYTDDILGTLDYLSVQDPAMPVYFSSTCKEDGTEVELLAGCADVASEGGGEPQTLFGSLSSGNDLLTLGAADIPTAVLAVKVPRTFDYNGEEIYNSRGAILDKLSAFCASADTITSAWISRDYSATTVDALTWSSLPDSHILTASGNSVAPLNTAFQADFAAGKFTKVLGEFTAKDTKTEIVNTSKNSDFKLSPGDIIVITGTGIQSTGQLYAATLYYSEEL